MGILLSVIPLALVAAVVVLIVGAVRRRGAAAVAGPPPQTHGIRRFFQYLLLYGLLIVAAIGTSNLLARLFGSTSRSASFAGGPDTSILRAPDLAVALGGTPLVARIAAGTWRSHRRDPDEGRSVLYAVYVTLMALTALVVAASALQSLVAAALYDPRFEADAAGRFIVWGAVWLAHWLLAPRTLPPPHRPPHLVLGSMVGLFLVTAGFVMLLGTSLDMLLRGGVVLGQGVDLAEGAGLFLAGALVWLRYWLLGASRDAAGTLWLVHVLVLGVGGGLILALVGASLLLWDTLVWFLGDPALTSPIQHFANATSQFACVAAGVLVWWYHRTILTRAGATGRTEVQRIYEYLVSGIGLLATAAGVGTVIVSLIESVTPGVDLGLSVQNTLLAALTLLVVGVPVWLTFWTFIRRKVSADPPAEVASRTRRVYLALLFGLAGVAAAIALIVVAVILLQDVVEGQVSGVTLRSMRYGLGVLVAAAAVSAYHGSVWREDRAVTVDHPQAGPRSIVMVGPAAPELVRDVARLTGARVHLWLRREGAGEWDREALLAAVAGQSGRVLLVLAEEDGPHVLEVDPDARG